ncbi:hypothetical protein BEP19_00345 [Ammoniphilus oxalaticus]|uniref:Uncharacterized protein n=1 Tax=Ammoniphilus oxalaticus TaxID=66863 RepID=A0A419SR92_9BACL|nr:hypothetical protein BEP19_00345 [Ammoniphilus oxalaticus]
MKPSKSSNKYQKQARNFPPPAFLRVLARRAARLGFLFEIIPTKGAGAAILEPNHDFLESGTEFWDLAVHFCDLRAIFRSAAPPAYPNSTI